MPTYTYTTGIPNGPNNPSTDQPNMKTNNDSNNSIWAEDHYGFNVANGGTHKQVRMPVLGSVPGSTIAGEGTLYTKTTSGNGELFFTPDATGDEYQMTTTSTGDIATFGTNTPYTANHTGGWTFLPGGLVMAYGVRAETNSTNVTISFPITFTTVYSLVVTQGKVSGTVNETGFYYRNITTTGFDIRQTSTVNHTFEYSFYAIGIL